MATQSEYGTKERAEYDTRERVVSTQKARSGIELHSMRYVLGFGIAGVVIAFFLAWYFMFRV
ncbi:hypothetical protein FNB15_10265 [Ferrovibrio terrae]|uniref:Uncharacterized protein n=1 Tax=Ferrovibrio terrae TaxID=2594003 RepID=A0A516H1G4_9PROT|nr:hypothetical protein [Ferrovibrio terrae]QDO97629.1 hypothetical protein FNB15_10265 [Ferrovibrio terrae]